MKKNPIYLLLLYFFLLISFHPSTAQTGQWTWMGGSDTINQYGLYGSVNAIPGGRSAAFSWMDTSGKLWLFGGSGYAASGQSSYLSDMWRYDPQSGNWTWVSGSNTLFQVGVWGTPGVAAPTNYPGNRYGGLSQKDADGNFLLFGGFGYKGPGAGENASGNFNDLWKYNVATGNWTWIKGNSFTNSLGTSGTLGVASAANNPRARSGSASWMDKNGNLWLFGGQTYLGPSVGPSGHMGDMWKYEVSTGNWTWMSGAAFQRGNYGVQGVPAATNVPGARLGSAAWTDTSGNLWLFGGTGYNTASVYGTFNDLWKYDIVTGLWVWVAGSNLINQPGVYGTQGIPAAANMPGNGNGYATWVDKNNNNLWLFGGAGSAVTGQQNNIWQYNIATSVWTWIKGSGSATPTATYGTLGIAASANNPGGRNRGASWIDTAGKFWLFGGLGYGASGATGSLNDLWRYDIGSTPLPLTLTSFLATRQGGAAFLQWTTSQEQNTSFFIVERSSNGRYFTQVSTIPAAGNTSSAHHYHFTDVSPLKGSNYYRLRNAGKDGTTDYSEIRLLNFGDSFSVALFPNPAKNKATLTGVEAGMRISIINASGQTVTNQEATGTTVALPVCLLPAGLYRVQVLGSSGAPLASITMVKE